MILTARNLRLIFQTLYGYRWANEAAKNLGVSLRSIRTWTSPGGRVPPHLRKPIETAIAAKIAELETLRDRMAGQAVQRPE